MQILIHQKVEKGNGGVVKKRMSVISKEHTMGELLFKILLLVCLWSRCYGTGFQLEGNITIYGMFPLHNVGDTIATKPQLADCNRYLINLYDLQKYSAHNMMLCFH